MATEENTSNDSLGSITDDVSQQVGTLGELGIDNPPVKPTEDAASTDGTKSEEQLKAEAELAKDIEDAKAGGEDNKPSTDDNKPDGFVTDDLISKAQEKGVESLSKEEQAHLVSEGVLKQESQVNDSPTSEFRTAIEAITGEEIEVDLTDTPLNTPEGLAKYLDAYASKRLDGFEESLEQRFPQAYRALQIESEGGNVSEYFKSQQVEGTDYTKVQLSDDDSTQHKNIIRSSYRLKGVDEDTINDIIKIAEDNNKLKDKATPELNYLQAAQKQQADAYAYQVGLQKQQDTRIMQSMVNTVDSLVERGEIGNFTIPKADRVDFLNHLKSTIEYKDGNFYVTKAVTPDSLEQIAQAEFFNFKKGNLGKYIKRAADTKLVLDLQSRMKKDKLSFADSNEEQLKNYITLGDIDK